MLTLSTASSAYLFLKHCHRHTQKECSSSYLGIPQPSPVDVSNKSQHTHTMPPYHCVSGPETYSVDWVHHCTINLVCTYINLFIILTKLGVGTVSQYTLNSRQKNSTGNGEPVAVQSQYPVLWILCNCTHCAVMGWAAQTQLCQYHRHASSELYCDVIHYATGVLQLQHGMWGQHDL